MRFADLQTEVQNFAQRTTADATVIKQVLNQTQDEIFQRFRWPFALTNGSLFTVAIYTTGTVTVTNGSRTLTGSGTTFTSAMIGRKFRLTADTPIYYITGFTSATVLTLDQAYNGTTASAQSYQIFADEVLLPADLDTAKLFRDQSAPYALRFWDPSDFDVEVPIPKASGRSWLVLHVGNSLIPLSDATGTVTITNGTATLTGSGTSWLTLPGLSRLSKITIGTNVYHAKTIDSNTQITLIENAAAAATASAFTITLDNPVLQLWPIPDAARQIVFRYYRQPLPMVNDGDSPDFPESWHWLLAVGATRRLYTYTGEIARHETLANEFERGIALMIESEGRQTIDKTMRMRSLDERRFLTGPRYPSNFPDVRFVE